MFRYNSNGNLHFAIVKGDEVSLHRALNIVHTKSHEYVAVLFYASWCPFSRIFRPRFSILSSLYPSIPHFAIEESTIRPRFVYHQLSFRFAFCNYILLRVGNNIGWVPAAYFLSMEFMGSLPFFFWTPQCVFVIKAPGPLVLLFLSIVMRLVSHFSLEVIMGFCFGFSIYLYMMNYCS